MGVKASDGLDDAFVPNTKGIFIEVILYFFFFSSMFYLVEKKKKIYISTRTSTFFFFFKKKYIRYTKEKCFLFTDKIYTEYIGYWTRC